MGLLTGALTIGRSAMLAYQSALQVVGNNISNAGSTSYTRQTPILTSTMGVFLPEGFTPGGGDVPRRQAVFLQQSLRLSRISIGIGQPHEAHGHRMSLGHQAGDVAAHAAV